MVEIALVSWIVAGLVGIIVDAAVQKVAPSREFADPPATPGDYEEKWRQVRKRNVVFQTAGWTYAVVFFLWLVFSVRVPSWWSALDGDNLEYALHHVNILGYGFLLGVGLLLGRFLLDKLMRWRPPVDLSP